MKGLHITVSLLSCTIFLSCPKTGYKTILKTAAGVPPKDFCMAAPVLITSVVPLKFTEGLSLLPNKLTAGFLVMGKLFKVMVAGNILLVLSGK